MALLYQSFNNQFNFCNYTTIEYKCIQKCDPEKLIKCMIANICIVTAIVADATYQNVEKIIKAIYEQLCCLLKCKNINNCKIEEFKCLIKGIICGKQDECYILEVLLKLKDCLMDILRKI